MIKLRAVREQKCHDRKLSEWGAKLENRDQRNERIRLAPLGTLSFCGTLGAKGAKSNKDATTKVPRAIWVPSTM